jgi:hypothetical protein
MGGCPIPYEIMIMLADGVCVVERYDLAPWLITGPAS